MTITPINDKYYRAVQQFVRYNAAYDELVNTGKEETRQAANMYEKALEVYSSLPKREQANICKHIPNVAGCY